MLTTGYEALDAELLAANEDFALAIEEKITDTERRAACALRNQIEQALQALLIPGGLNDV